MTESKERVHMVEMEAKIDKKFKEFEVSIFQTLGLIDPYFQRIVGEMINRHKEAVIQIVNLEIDVIEGTPNVETK